MNGEKAKRIKCIDIDSSSRLDKSEFVECRSIGLPLPYKIYTRTALRSFQMDLCKKGWIPPISPYALYVPMEFRP